MTTDGYRALRKSAALLDLTGRGFLRASGEDRSRLLHNLSTNHVKQLEPGQGLYAFFLSVQGRILGDAYILCREDALLLDTEPETARTLFSHIEKYIIADDVEIEDRTAETAVLGVEGPEAGRVLAAAGVPLPEAASACLEWEGTLIARISSTGQPGYRLYLPLVGKAALMERLAAPAASAGDARMVRVENGEARYGDDFTAESLPQETQRMHAVHFNKGCYLGQEIVERLRARGHVNWLLSRLAIDAATAPAQGARVLAAEKEVGEITSAVVSPATGRVAALGWLRAEALLANAALSVDGARTTLVSGGA
ncbi:MAG: folate-binding protein [Acidobacteria bacterium]|nr:folate-binding protein [Acidobacteriota bacterium]